MKYLLLKLLLAIISNTNNIFYQPLTLILIPLMQSKTISGALIGEKLPRVNLFGDLFELFFYCLKQLLPVQRSNTYTDNIHAGVSGS